MRVVEKCFVFFFIFLFWPWGCMTFNQRRRKMNSSCVRWVELIISQKVLQSDAKIAWVHAILNSCKNRHYLRITVQKDQSIDLEAESWSRMSSTSNSGFRTHFSRKLTFSMMAIDETLLDPKRLQTVCPGTSCREYILIPKAAAGTQTFFYFLIRQSMAFKQRKWTWQSIHFTTSLSVLYNPIQLNSTGNWTSVYSYRLSHSPLLSDEKKSSLNCTTATQFLKKFIFHR